jgi:6-pyruvoyl-tetrahydropterin synthase
MHTIHRSIDVSFAHHVRGHSGACINVHGHTWKFEVGLAATELDREGFVVDFGLLKRDVLEPVHRLLDHSLAVGVDTFAEVEGELGALGAKLLGSRAAVHGAGAQFPGAERLTLHGAEIRLTGGMKVAVFPFAPTSERLAEWLHGLAESCLADDRVHVAFARVYETLHPVESVATFQKR